MVVWSVKTAMALTRCLGLWTPRVGAVIHTTTSIEINWVGSVKTAIRQPAGCVLPGDITAPGGRCVGGINWQPARIAMPLDMGARLLNAGDAMRTSRALRVRRTRGLLDRIVRPATVPTTGPPRFGSPHDYRSTKRVVCSVHDGVLGVGDRNACCVGTGIGCPCS
jgi:hypothetical protein